MKIIRFITLVSVLLASPVFAAGMAHAEDHLAMPKFPAGWVEAFSRRGDQEVVEYVPSGQNAAAWKEKITLEIYHDLNNLPLDALQRRALAQMREVCTGVVEGKFQSGLNNGYASAFWTLGCKRNRKAGLGETQYTKAIQGKTELYILTRIWRTAPFDDAGPDVSQQSVDEAMAFLTSSMVCEKGSAAHPCPAETPVGAPPRR
jgi:hypothetical protein